jgi:hypothetical protein
LTHEITAQLINDNNLPTLTDESMISVGVRENLGRQLQYLASGQLGDWQTYCRTGLTKRLEENRDYRDVIKGGAIISMLLEEAIKKLIKNSQDISDPDRLTQLLHDKLKTLGFLGALIATDMGLEIGNLTTPIKLDVAGD